MESNQAKPVIGILGGIGSGKSTVAAEFGKLGCAVIDADRIAHEMLDEPTVKKQIIETFGNSILDSNSRIDRAKLANLAFADADSLAKLNAIVHPPVLAEVERRIERFGARDKLDRIGIQRMVGVIDARHVKYLHGKIAGLPELNRTLH